MVNCQIIVSRSHSTYPCFGCWLWNRLAIVAKGFDVKLDGFLHQLFGFLNRVTAGDAAGEIGNEGGIILAGPFVDHRVLFHDSLRSRGGPFRQFFAVDLDVVDL